MDHRVCMFIEAVQTSIRRTDLTDPAEDNVQELDLHGVPTNTIGRWEAAEGLCHVEKSKKTKRQRKKSAEATSPKTAAETRRRAF